MSPGRTFLLASLVLLQGCHSAFVNATVRNTSGQIISLIEVDYPSASFGIQTLAPAASYSYRFKVLGIGPLKVMYTDAQSHEHTSQGPTLHEGLMGSLDISLSQATVNWTQHLQER